MSSLLHLAPAQTEGGKQLFCCSHFIERLHREGLNAINLQYSFMLQSDLERVSIWCVRCWKGLAN